MPGLSILKLRMPQGLSQLSHLTQQMALFVLPAIYFKFDGHLYILKKL